MEYDAEREEYKRMSEHMPLRRKIRRGICWFPLRVGRDYYNSLNQLVVEVFRDDEAEDIDHNFEYGRPVAFFREAAPAGGNTPAAGNLTAREAANPVVKMLPYVCQVSYVDGGRMVVTLPSPQALIDLQSASEAKLGIQLYFDETSYRTMFHALDDVMKARGNRLEQLRDLFAGMTPPRTLSFSSLSFPWLNSAQQLAVNNVLRAKDVAVVHGPPGTGKTTTLVEAIHETLRRETQVMVCAQSNMAVDWICEKLVDYGISVLRIGNPTRVNDKMLSFTYERRFADHPDYAELWSVRKALRQLRAGGHPSDNRHQKIARLRDRATEIEMRIQSALFNEARVVACTLVGSANKLLVHQHFSTLFIDEAAQALEPACWIAIRRADRVVLAGDHQQLPPTVKCLEAQRQGLGVTLMERVVANVPTAVTLLQVQYRMSEPIMRFSSQWFYDGKMQAAPQVRHRSILDYEVPIQWIDTHPYAEMAKAGGEALQPAEGEEGKQNGDAFDFHEHYVGENHGRINKAEANLTLHTLQRYIERIGVQRFLDERLDIGIISPYRMQAQYLRQLIRNRDFFRPLRDSISVNTVDGFQGQERDIIVISLVRSNEAGQIGFLNDLRRMNVAMTRARQKLLVIGDADTLAHHPFYRKLKAYIDSLQLTQETE